MDQILVTRPSMPDIEEYFNEIKDMWDTHWLTNMGPKHCKLQKELKDYLGVSDIDLLTNGHMALELAIQALGLNYGNKFQREGHHKNDRKLEVITTPFTFASTTHAIVRNGLEPVFCDINMDDFTIDINKLEELVTDYTVAILPVHVYGNICKIEEIQRIADKYGLKVIYDAAHAFGETYREKGIGSYGNVSCFSFHATKVFNTIEGGAVCFSDSDFGKELYRLKNFGIKNEDVVDGVGANAKMNEFCAAMGICNLRHLEENITKRKVITERYDERLRGTAGIQIRKIQKNVKSNYGYYPIIIDEKVFGKSRNEIYTELKNHEIYARKYFYPLTNTFECFHGQYDVSLTPNALYISNRVLTLPIYSDLSLNDVDKVCDIILK